MASGFVDHEGDMKRPNSMAMEEDDKDLNQHEDEMMMADGGQIMDNEQSDAHMLDMISRVMSKRKMMSEGGKVANSCQFLSLPYLDFQLTKFG